MRGAELRPDLAKGIILVEAACILNRPLTPEEIGLALGPATLLNVYGDYVEDHPSFWPGLDADCEEIADTINEIGGNALHLRLPEIGVFGNDHMMMMDKNSAQLADIMMDWIEENVE